MGSTSSSPAAIATNQSHNPAHQQRRKILVAVDESNASRDCIDWAIQKLIQPSDEIHIVSVVDPGRTQEVIAAAESAYPIESVDCKPNPFKLERRCELLRNFRQQLKPVNCDVKLTTLVTCTPGSSEIGRQIARYAQTENTDLVVMGSRGMGSAERAVMSMFGLGSCSEFVVRHANNVLVHRAPPPPSSPAAISDASL